MRELDWGRVICFSGCANSESRCAACLLVGLRARFFRARWERGSADVGIDSGMFSDIFLYSVEVLCGVDCKGYCVLKVEVVSGR